MVEFVSSKRGGGVNDSLASRVSEQVNIDLGDFLTGPMYPKVTIFINF
jgi:hypothetical protein